MVAMKERRRSPILLLGLYMLLYIFVKHVANIQALYLQGEWEKFTMLCLVYENIEIGAYEVKNICMHLWTEKDFRKQTRVK